MTAKPINMLHNTIFILFLYHSFCLNHRHFLFQIDFILKFFHSSGVVQTPNGNRIPACSKSPSSRHTQPLPVPPSNHNTSFTKPLPTPQNNFTKPLPPPQSNILTKPLLSPQQNNNNNSNNSLLPVPLTNPANNPINSHKQLQQAQSYRWVLNTKSSKPF